MPKEVEEAALIDGLGPVGVWWRIAVPMAGSGFKTVALFSFVAAWTDLLIPLTMSTRLDGWTLPAGIMQMQTGFKIYWGALMAGGLYLTIHFPDCLRRPEISGPRRQVFILINSPKEQ
jgi:ABC-type glycerol-3-phosphate transport system permease component